MAERDVVAGTPRPFPRGPGATALREQTAIALLRWWWAQPFEYQWVHAYAVSRAWLRADRVVIAGWYVLCAALGITLLVGARPHLAITAALAVAVVACGVAALWWWVDRPWPSERSSLASVAVSEVSAFTLVLAAPSGTAALALISLYVLPGFYVMFLHSPRVLLAHVAWVIALVAGAGTYVCAATDTDTLTAAILIIAQLAVGTAGFVLSQIALTFLRADARNSFTDPLTGLLNRRGLYEAVAYSVTRYPSPVTVSVLMVDVDKFKPLNDLQGHHHGDVVLVDVAHLITARCDSTADALARIGGDEFTAVVHLDAEAATALAHRLCTDIATLHPNSVLTVSVGVHTTSIEQWPPTETAVEEFLTHADTALYAAKRAGGNTVRSYP
ncbi:MULTISPECIES: GGDEF domain-containing protein [Actinomycetes]|uniref:GGDEF domain-containing protein n=1 Tax=Actinomycetes TaxID=1760 RepID=UPI0018CC3DE5|nr:MULTISPECIES: GGDEF domain-containing protein [Actinomycetes]